VIGLTRGAPLGPGMRTRFYKGRRPAKALGRRGSGALLCEVPLAEGPGQERDPRDHREAKDRDRADDERGDHDADREVVSEAIPVRETDRGHDPGEQDPDHHEGEPLDPDVRVTGPH